MSKKEVIASLKWVLAAVAIGALLGSLVGCGDDEASSTPVPVVNNQVPYDPNTYGDPNSPYYQNYQNCNGNPYCNNNTQYYQNYMWQGGNNIHIVHAGQYWGSVPYSAYNYWAPGGWYGMNLYGVGYVSLYFGAYAYPFY